MHIQHSKPTGPQAAESIAQWMVDEISASKQKRAGVKCGYIYQ